LDNTPEAVEMATLVITRNTGLKSGVTETVKNYMGMAGESNCDMFAAA
jgi:hypothetical protein